MLRFFSIFMLTVIVKTKTAMSIVYYIIMIILYIRRDTDRVLVGILKLGEGVGEGGSDIFF